MDALAHARLTHRRRITRWGFRWALRCAVLWGAWYVPGTAVWRAAPFVTLAGSATTAAPVCAAIVGLCAACLPQARRFVHEL